MSSITTSSARSTSPTPTASRSRRHGGRSTPPAGPPTTGTIGSSRTMTPCPRCARFATRATARRSPIRAFPDQILIRSPPAGPGGLVQEPVFRRLRQERVGRIGSGARVRGEVQDERGRVRLEHPPRNGLPVDPHLHGDEAGAEVHCQLAVARVEDLDLTTLEYSLEDGREALG